MDRALVSPVGSLIPEGVRETVRVATASIVKDALTWHHAVRNVWGYAPWPDHSNRRCVDFMVNTRADGDWLYRWIWSHRDPYQVDLIIWRRTITRRLRHFPFKAGARAPYLGKDPHTGHLHVQFTGVALPEPRAPFLGPWEVDPGLVHTFLWSRTRTWANGKRRAPGFKVKTGVAIVRRGGQSWVQTEAGNYYALAYLRRL